MIASITTCAAAVDYANHEFNATIESRPRNAFKVKDEQSSKKDRVIKKDFIDAGHSNTSDVHVLPRRTSLKRKEPHDGFDQDDNQDLGYPHNLANIYPRKRCRPSLSEKGKDEVLSPSSTISVAPDCTACDLSHTATSTIGSKGLELTENFRLLKISPRFPEHRKSKLNLKRSSHLFRGYVDPNANTPGHSICSVGIYAYHERTEQY